MTAITVLAGGVGGARFTRGLREHLAGTDAAITVIANTGDDMWLAGLRVCPDLDSIMYTLGGANDDVRGWGRVGESERVSAELDAYGIGWPWFTLGDLDLGTHIARSALLRDGLTLTEATEQLCARWNLGVRLLPVSDDEVETNVEIIDPADGTRRVIHFEEWWVRHRAAVPARRFVQRGIEGARATDAAVEAIGSADVVLVAPSNPVVSIGTLVAIPGIAGALAVTAAPVVGVSPIIDGRAVRGMAEACLAAIGVAATSGAVARHYGSRRSGGLLDGWLVDAADAAALPGIESAGIRAAAVPLWMNDLPSSAHLAADALLLADRIRARIT
ncbi:2-phospho-L-lactate transferase [Marisediminicola antarctica]|uniref:2-phospho-L-lactate transferase n=1 Tax=Marisediminicola antarctica TaxID=674079 RepID=A0A7L5AJC0_9MICO|nr:2-phospho-L-lactate transferase [Marisediminicola antarctica]QHO70703.1 2-phospho-L-lactate transferase [Marisediminicola antarctica]